MCSLKRSLAGAVSKVLVDSLFDEGQGFSVNPCCSIATMLEPARRTLLRHQFAQPPLSPLANPDCVFE
jgi:hypothetical protein